MAASPEIHSCVREPIETVYTTDGPFPGYVNYFLVTQSKSLEVCLDLRERGAWTDANYKDRIQIKGTTTLLYTRANHLIQLETNRLGLPIIYELKTRVPVMQNWALDKQKGGKIFDWEGWIWFDDYLIATKTFRPQ